LNEPWFCISCVARRPISRVQPEQSNNRLFGKILGDFDQQNPITYRLPEYVRHFFEGVEEGKNGEYVETVKPRGRFVAFVLS